jgi:NADPH:quinone reductase-like Zn-dependent oxidoreductase
MKASRLQAYGDTTQFKLEQAPEPVATPGHVVIKVEASGLNPVDAYIRMGYLAKMVPMQLPAILGIDAAGTITAIGPDVTGYAVGDRVIAHLPINGFGARAEFAPVPLAGLAKLAANVSFADGATLPLAGLSARQAVDALGAKAGARVLVSGALGAIGRATIQYLKELGMVAVAGVRASRIAEAKALGVDAIDIDKTPAVGDFDFAVSTAAPAAASAIMHVRDGGTLTSVVQVPEGANAGGRISIVSIATSDNQKQLQAIADAAARGEPKIPIVATFTLAQIGAAHDKLAAPQLGGKVIVTP